METDDLFDDYSAGLLVDCDANQLEVLTGLAIMLGEGLKGETAHSALMILDEQFPNFRRALDWFLRQDAPALYPYAHDLYEALRDFLELRGHDDEFRRWGAAITARDPNLLDPEIWERVAPFVEADGTPVIFSDDTLNRLTADEVSAFAEMYNLYGVTRINRDPMTSVLPFFEEALRLKAHLGEPLGVVGVLINISQAYYWAQDDGGALDYAGRAYQAARASGDLLLTGQTGHHYAVMLDSAGELERAAAIYQECLALLAQVNDTQERTQMMFSSAVNAYRRGLKREALTLAETSAAAMGGEAEAGTRYLYAWIRQIHEELGDA